MKSLFKYSSLEQVKQVVRFRRERLLPSRLVAALILLIVITTTVAATQTESYLRHSTSSLPDLVRKDSPPPMKNLMDMNRLEATTPSAVDSTNSILKQLQVASNNNNPYGLAIPIEETNQQEEAIINGIRHNEILRQVNFDRSQKLTTLPPNGLISLERTATESLIGNEETIQKKAVEDSDDQEHKMPNFSNRKSFKQLQQVDDDRSEIAEVSKFELTGENRSSSSDPALEKRFGLFKKGQHQQGGNMANLGGVGIGMPTYLNECERCFLSSGQTSLLQNPMWTYETSSRQPMQAVHPFVSHYHTLPSFPFNNIKNKFNKFHISKPSTTTGDFYGNNHLINFRSAAQISGRPFPYQAGLNQPYNCIQSELISSSSNQGSNEDSKHLQSIPYSANVQY